MKKSRIVSFILAAVVLLCQLSFGVFSAPVIYDVDGLKAAFVSSFGKLVYDGAREAFKTFEEARASLTDGSGMIVFTGKHTFEGENIGGGEKFVLMSNTEKTSGNIIVFSSKNLSAQSDIKLSNMFYQVKKGATLVMNGHDLELTDEIDAFYTAEMGTNKRIYSDLLSISSGDASEEYGFIIEKGHYDTVSLASGNVSADSTHELSGDYQKVIVGSASGKTDADIVVRIKNADIKELVIGAENGKMNGKILVDIENSTIGKISAGAYGASSSFDGNAAIVTKNTTVSEIASAGDGKVSAAVVYVMSGVSDVKISDKAKYESVVMVSDGFCEPDFDGNGALAGIRCFDTLGRTAKAVVSEGKELLSENGIYKTPEGIFKASVVCGTDFEVNDAASFVKGYDDGTFAPQNNMTRAEAITLLNRIVINDENYIKNGSFENRFEDVPAGEWYEKYITYFDTLGLFDRIADGNKIRPDEKITRGQFVQLIYNIEKALYEGKTGVTYKEFAKLFYNVSQSYEKAADYESFSDVAYDNKHNNAIYYALARGYVTGYTGGTFLPDGDITRAEVVTVVNRMLGRKPTGSGDGAFTDISDHWAKPQILAATGADGVSWTDSSDELLTADGKTQAQFLMDVLGRRGTDIQFMMSNHLFKTASEAIISADFPADAKADISAAIDQLRTDAWTSEKVRVINGSPEDTDTYVYSYGGAPNIREIYLTSNKPETEDVHIVEFNDIHFGYFNELDELEQNPALMSTKEHRGWMKNGTSKPSARSSMRYSRYADLTVLNGDILDFMSHGAKQLTIENLFRLDNDVFAVLGNHESALRVEGKVADNMKYEDKFEFLQEFWPVDALYHSTVLKDKVLCVGMENGISYYTAEQVARLKEDIELARRNNYIVLIFNHQPIASRNPDEEALVSINGKETKNIATDPICREGYNIEASAEMYDLITSNADVIKALFVAHNHVNMISKIPATYTDKDENVVETFITQHINTSNAFDQNGNVMRIIVD